MNDKIKLIYEKIGHSSYWLDMNHDDIEVCLIWNIFEYFRKTQLEEWKCSCWGNIFIHEHEDVFSITWKQETMCDNIDCLLDEEGLDSQDKFLHVKNDLCFWPEYWGDFTKPIEKQSAECINYVYNAIKHGKQTI